MAISQNVLAMIAQGGTGGQDFQQNYLRGLQARNLMDEQSRAGQARQLLGQYLQGGGQNVLAQLAGADPDTALRIQQMEAQKSRQAVEDQRWHQQFASTQAHQAATLEQQRAATNAPKFEKYGETGVINQRTGEVTPSGIAAPSLKPTVLKMKRETENNIVSLENTLGILRRASDLAPQSFEGMGAGARGYVGTRAPILAPLVGGEKGAKATAEWGDIMSLESIESMAETLKGATTDFELREFKKILADPSAPSDLKLRTIGRMRDLATKKLELERGRMTEFGDDVPEATPKAKTKQGLPDGDPIRKHPDFGKVIGEAKVGTIADGPNGEIVVWDGDGWVKR